MTIKYILKVMYGDADGEDTNKLITSDEKEIKFFDYLVSHYKEISELDRFDLGCLENPNCVDVVNGLIKAYNELINNNPKFSNNDEDELIEDDDGANDVLFDMLYEIEDIYHWKFYNGALDYWGTYRYSTREDISNKRIMTKLEIENALGYTIEIKGDKK